MKKIFTLAMAFAVVAGAFAADLNRAQQVRPTRQASVANLHEMPVYERGEARVAKQVAGAGVDTLYYGRPYNAFYLGYYPDFSGYSAAFTVFTTTDTVEYINGSHMSSSDRLGWTIDDGANLDESDNLFFVLPGELEGYQDEVFELSLALMDASNDSYKYGETAENGSAILVEPMEERYPLTKCAMYAPLSLDPNGYDCYYMNWSDDDTYFMGTGMDILGGLVDTLVTYMGTATSALDVDTISLFITSNNANPIPNGLKLNVIGEHGLLASYNATVADIYDWTPEQGRYFGMVNFPVKFVAQGEFMVMLSGLNTGNNNFGIFTDVATWYDMDGDIDGTYFVRNGKLRGFGNNIALFFNAKFTNATALENQAAAVKAQKRIENNRVVIEKNGKRFDVLGAQL